MTQRCPNCQRVHDIGVYVSGQKLTCACGIRFEVQRSDVSSARLTEPRGAEIQADPSGLLPTVAPSTRGAPAPSGPNPTLSATAAAPVLPGFELEKILGRGGMGEVWRARQLSLNRTVAVKLLPTRLASDREFVARFDKEATALAALSHPHIIQIIDRGHHGEHYYFVMEFVPGRSARELLNTGRAAPEVALRIALQTAQAIGHAHEQAIVHRDLKPENILVDERGNVKVADFGLAGMRTADGSYDLTASSVAMGTVNYMAPEQRRDAKHVDQRADLYSLGVVLYELLTGELPIGRFRLPGERVPGLDPRVDRLLERLLEPDPAMRPATAGEVVSALEPLVSSAPSVAPPSASLATPGLSQAPSSVLQRSWSGLKVVLMLVGALAVFIAVVRAIPQGGGEVAPLTAPAWYGDSEDTLSVAAAEGEALRTGFEPGQGLALNTHAGLWTLDQGSLRAVQWGQATAGDEHPRLVPRAYVSSRYYSADQARLEVDLEVRPLGREFPPVDPEAQRYAELAFRIRDVQVSVFAIPGVGPRLLWRYFDADGHEQAGNSARDQMELVEDEAQLPSGRFRLRLELARAKGDAVDVTAYVNGQRFARKVLRGLGGQVGKVALGCRNLECRFDDLAVSGKAAPRPAARPGGGSAAE